MSDWKDILAKEKINRDRGRPYESARVHVITVSDSRTTSTDISGARAAELLEAAGHVIQGRSLVHDDADEIRELMKRLLSDPGVEAIVSTGGTGISPRDCTVRTMREMFDLELPGFGEVFRWLSFQEIGTVTLMSMATAGVAGRKPVFVIPGSPNAVRLAVEDIIAVRLGQILRELHKREPSPLPR